MTTKTNEECKGCKEIKNHTPGVPYCPMEYHTCNKEITATKTNEGLIVARLYGIKNSLVKSYPDAESWSRDYLNDNIKTLQEFDLLIKEVEQILTQKDKEILLTQDYSVATKVTIGEKQTIPWGGKELTVTSQENDGQIIIQLDLLDWGKEQTALAVEKEREKIENPLREEYGGDFMGNGVRVGMVLHKLKPHSDTLET